MSNAGSDCIAWGLRQLKHGAHADPIATRSIKHRAWSTVWKIDCAGGSFYLKQAGPGYDVEAPLLSALCTWRPAPVVELVAADTARGWVLTRDAGRMLHDVMFDEPESGRALLRSILLAYAELQVACRQHGAPLFMHMLEDRRPAALSNAFATVVMNDALLRDGGATPEDFAQRHRWLRTVEHLCHDLAALDLPASLEHGDLHTSNIMVAADGTPRIADWGDACWATPLHALAMCLNDISGRHKMACDDPWFAGLFSAYIAIWRQAGFACDFERALPIVRALAPASGVLQWSRGVERMPPDARALVAGHIVKHLRALKPTRDAL